MNEQNMQEASESVAQKRKKGRRQEEKIDRIKYNFRCPRMIKKELFFCFEGYYVHSGLVAASRPLEIRGALRAKSPKEVLGNFIEKAGTIFFSFLCFIKF